MLCQYIKTRQLIYKKIFKKTYATTGLKWLVSVLNKVMPTSGADFYMVKNSPLIKKG